jgi:pimeloyl-ACP methyl ester carboxylesterase
MGPSRSEFIVLRARRYHVRIWGEDDAPTIFCLHGWGDTGASFQFVADALPDAWRVVAPDWRGFGLSQWNEGAYWFLDYIADLDALLGHYSPTEPARIAGHSMGGIVASLYAGIEAQRVAQLASLEGFAPWVSAPEEMPGRLAKWLRQNRDKDAAFHRYADRDQFASRLRADNPRLKPERAAFLAEHSLREGDDGFVFAADPRHRWISPALFPLPEAMACWRRISAPTLWIAGRESSVAKAFADHPDAYGERRACFAKLQERWLADCGHNLHHDQPEALAGLLDAFFR